MDKESCIHCGSNNTEFLIIDEEPWWRCNYQGCSGVISGGKFFWKTGEEAIDESSPKKKRILYKNLSPNLPNRRPFKFY